MRSPKERFLFESVPTLALVIWKFCLIIFLLLEKLIEIFVDFLFLIGVNYADDKICRWLSLSPATNFLSLYDSVFVWPEAEIFVEFLVPKRCQLHRQQICRHCQWLRPPHQRVLNDLERARFSRGQMIWLLAHPFPPFPVNKLDRRQSLRKRDNLLPEEGGRGRPRSRIIRPQESLVLYESFKNCLMGKTESQTSCFIYCDVTFTVHACWVHIVDPKKLPKILFLLFICVLY